MKEYRFKIIINHQPKNDDEIFDLGDKLAEAGCLDGHLGGHVEGMEIEFEREAISRDDAIKSAIKQVESCGLSVSRVELDREAISA